MTSIHAKLALTGLAMGLGLACTQAQAQSRPDSLRMSCASAARLVSTRGAVVLGSGPDIYDRYVATQQFCLPDEITKPAWVPAADTRQCFVGYRCERVDDEFSPR
ncbi:MAG: hypothetical protein JWL62_2524 [Hyphomicrobiales bacterium]|jgi:hypothetical protein|nr:hypothetical protein [Hyphomicrobiales bacterium]